MRSMTVLGREGRALFRWPARPLLLALPFLVLLPACGGDDSTGPGIDPPPGDGPIRALVDGVPWSTDSATQTASLHTSAGFWSVSGADVDGTSFRNITLTLMNLPGPGTYPLGTGSGVAGGTAIYVDPSGGWTTPLSGAAGTVTLTTLTESAIRGTFAFTAEATTGGATGTRTITEGSFDLPVTTTGQFDPLPGSRWNVVHARIDGEPWVGSTVAGGGTMGQNLVWSANNTRWTLSLVLGNVTAVGTYEIGTPGTLVSASASGSGTNSVCCWGTIGEATGSITVTTAGPERMQGTFRFVLQPSPGSGATEPLTVTDGVFDFGL